MLHYDFIQQYSFQESDYQVEGNIEFLQGRRGARGRRNIEPVTVKGIKGYLAESGIRCRPEAA
jgi:hypothetical protein